MNLEAVIFKCDIIKSLPCEREGDRASGGRIGSKKLTFLRSKTSNSKSLSQLALTAPLI